MTSWWCAYSVTCALQGQPRRQTLEEPHLRNAHPHTTTSRTFSEDQTPPASAPNTHKAPATFPAGIRDLREPSGEAPPVSAAPTWAVFWSSSPLSAIHAFASSRRSRLLRASLISTTPHPNIVVD